MCGRYTLTTPQQILQAAFALTSLKGSDAGATNDPRLDHPRYNIAPTQKVAIIANRPPAQGRKIEFFRWGLIPSWAKDMKISHSLINARSETAAEKPSFRSAFRSRRCLVLADAFYEWKAVPPVKGAKAIKTPTCIRMKSHAPFAFAGLWETWIAPEGAPIESCTILTTEPNPLLAQVHDRMPVILSPESYAKWLSPTSMSAEELQPLMKAYPENQMETFTVSPLVNSPANERPECMVPVN